jgi:uncharacterized protein
VEDKMEKEISFSCEGFKLAGTLFIPNDLGQGERRSGVIICKGFGANARDSATIINFARYFYEKGYIVLSLDYRGFEEGEQPRLKMIPIVEAKDIRNAIAFLQQQPEVDRDDIAIVELH